MDWKYKISLIFPLALLACVTCFATFGIRTTRLETLQRMVQRNIRMGETPHEVIDFLKTQNLVPSDLIQPQVMRIQGHDYGGENIVVAVKRYSARALLWKEMIYLVFVFDGDRRLIRYDVFPAYESL